LVWDESSLIGLQDYKYLCAAVTICATLNIQTHRQTDRQTDTYTDNILTSLFTVSQKTVQNRFCQNLVKSPPILMIFGKKMAKRLELCEMHSLSTSPNSCHHTTVLNAYTRHCYTTPKVVICSKLSNDLINTQ